MPGGRDRRAAISASCSGPAVATMPSAPTSIVSRNSLASSVPWDSAMSWVPEPWNAAMRFSRGMTFQSREEMITRSAPFRAYALSRSPGTETVTIWATARPSRRTSSPLTTRALKRPSRRSGSSSSRMMMSVRPASSAAVTTLFLASYVSWRSALTQMSFSMCITATVGGPRPPWRSSERCRRPPSSWR